ncbi:MAG: alpha/beta hydrolase family protein, partial [bacterium]
VGLCKIIQKLGMTAARVTLPYHEERCPGGHRRADYMVSPNIGRTIHAVRQAVLEVRQLVRWLRERRYRKIGLVGTSIGSCIGYLAFAHDTGIDTAVFNHVSAYFADVVWTGLSTRYVQWGLEGNIKLPGLRACWAPLSPWHYVEKLRENIRPHRLITAKYDLTFLPELGELLLERYRSLDLPCDLRHLPCGHYTTAHFPFKYLDGWYICRYLKSRLG